ncbi:MAG TPA: hypothetical protein VGB52_07355 [Actinomycetota bacterium]
MVALAKWLEDPLVYWGFWLGWVTLWIAWTVWRDLGGGSGVHRRR